MFRLLTSLVRNIFNAPWDGYSRKGQKESQKRPNQARNGKDKVKSKPKSVKVKSQPSEGLKLPNLKLYYKNKKTRAEIGN
ncbi:hypothetical protein Tco_0354338 [Tanacetum coccineum]